MTTLTYENVTQEQIDAVLNLLRSAGADIEQGPIRKISGRGFVGAVGYSGTTLEVQILNKPWFVSESLIDSQIKKALGRA